MLTVLMLLFAAAAFAQPDRPPDTLWTRAYGTDAEEQAFGVAQTADGGYLYVGQHGPTTSGPFNFLGVRTNGNGDVLWTRTYGGDAGDVARAAVQTNDAGFLIAGTTTSFGALSGDIWVIKVDFNGDSVWSRRYGGTGYEETFGLAATGDDFVITGSTTSTDPSRDAFLMKISSTGDSLWFRVFGGTSLQYARSVQTITDGFVIVGGSDANQQRDVMVVRTTESGAIAWNRTYGGSAFDEASCVKQTPDGGFIVGGTTHGAISHGSADYFLLKLTAAGDTSWWRAYGGADYDEAWGVSTASDGGYVIAGRSQSVIVGNYECWMVKADNAGNQVWAVSAGGPSTELCFALTRTHDGGYIVVGSTRSFGHGQDDVYVVRYSGFSGVGGIVTDEVSGDIVPGARISAPGAGLFGVSDDQGHYLVVLPPGPTDLIVYGPCVERDTIRDVTVIEDSIIAVDIAIGLPEGRVPQTSVNIVAQNHQPSTGTLQVQNFGHGLLDYYAVVGTSEPATPWLSIAPATGLLAQGEVEELTLTVTADTTDTGTYDYFGFLDVHMNSCPDSVFHVIVTAVVVNSESERQAALAAQYSLGAYPNPFNPVTNISWTLVREQEIRLDLFDVGGRKVAELASGRYASGEHRTQLDARALSSGVYFARLSGEDVQLVTKLMLMK